MFNDLQIQDNELCVSRNGLLVPIYFFQQATLKKTGFLQQSYTRESVKKYDMDYRFEAELKYDGYHKGQSSVTICFCDDLFNGEMFLSDFNQLIMSGMNVSQSISGLWGFCKKGSNIGLKYYGKK